MASQWVDLRDLKFLLHEVFKIGEDILGKGKFADHDADMVNMVLDQAAKFTENDIAPTYPDEVQRKPVEAVFKDGKVYAPEAYHRLYKLYCEGGWMSVSDSPEVGGQGFPAMIAAACAQMFLAGNQAFLMYPGLGHGAARLVEDFFQHPLRELILEKMYTGVWGGTMCLTEPGAGSDVGALKTTAKKNADGTYSITGTKCFISSGDHDLTENIIHPVLARIEGHEPGTKGISIFVVPKIRINPDGSLGEPNDVNCGGIESKMGIHGNATCTLNFGENGKCIGWLMGEEKQGMPIMFHMMNEERQGVGTMGVALSTTAYLHALSYAKERFQGVNIMQMKDPNAKQTTIINHPDIRRMLLKMKSMTEGIKVLALFCYYAMDRMAIAADDAEKEKWQGMIEMYTPLVKAYCTDVGDIVTNLAVQTYGGYGFCREYPVEQMMRDNKINTIYEGTNGIQALDLLGRKLGMKKGLYFMNMLGETAAEVGKAKANENLKAEAEIVEKALNACAGTAMQFSQLIKTNPFIPLVAATDYLGCLAEALCGWFHIWMANVATEKLAANPIEQEKMFYTGKVEGAKFFINRITALVPAKLETLTKDEISCIRIPDDAFAV
ncbi:MAG TPA: acyl-CoA dehydrogenase [Deltaproteobacteria bacterium]|jgi:alkylation response protein AidB-like acyl-CoA dehydrogenase|nr:acyl-CoA dehydrogenase [Deltaproteobacteria bacterium]HRW80543.1 acyl-CoA dehydrogenase [Desulfomonilia bacterium]HNQ86034.1 acyl-CoA dehydrogenase [Deltaproteobacteria bacterium]HNS90352.1 acyl-CoA dehydrogenase [Deltaproteobacteria bacterium]HOA45249.1 acyl-CoA dehydrogenase [Deltaproteobacteria bacterium]